MWATFITLCFEMVMTFAGRKDSMALSRVKKAFKPNLITSSLVEMVL